MNICLKKYWFEYIFENYYTDSDEAVDTDVAFDVIKCSLTNMFIHMVELQHK